MSRGRLGRYRRKEINFAWDRGFWFGLSNFCSTVIDRSEIRVLQSGVMVLRWPALEITIRNFLCRRILEFSAFVTRNCPSVKFCWRCRVCVSIFYCCISAIRNKYFSVDPLGPKTLRPLLSVVLVASLDFDEPTLLLSSCEVAWLAEVPVLVIFGFVGLVLAELTGLRSKRKSSVSEVLVDPPLSSPSFVLSFRFAPDLKG